MNNLARAGEVLDALVQGGVGLVAWTPGARNLPLLCALKAHPSLERVECVDERAAAFLALGWIRGRALVGRGLTPAAVLCTSGTAVLNLLPAVAEALEAGLPLVLLTADRPPEALGCGANQTLDQLAPLHPLLRAQLALDVPGPGASPVGQRIREALAHCRGLEPGPLQINMPFREPLLESQDVIAENPVAPVQPGPVADCRRHPDAGARLWWENEACRARGLVHVLDLPRREDRQAARLLSRRLGWPLLADGGSGLWGRSFDPDAPPLITHGESCLAELAEAEFVLQLGKRPVSRMLLEGLSFLPRLVVDEHPGLQDPLRKKLCRWRIRPLDLLQAMEEEGWSAPKPDLDWWSRLEQAQTAVSLRQVESLREPGLCEAHAARTLALQLPEDWGWFVGNSLPVRLLDQWMPCLESDRLVAANRGMSGIDGLLAAALGFQQGLGRPAAALLGDLSLMHDFSSLVLLARYKPPLLVLVLNNRGGGIFRLHPDSAKVAPAWATHDQELAPAAAALGLESCQPVHRRELVALVEDFRARPRAMVVELMIPAEDHGRRVKAARRVGGTGCDAAPPRDAVPPRVLLHGFLGDPADWDGVLAQPGWTDSPVPLVPRLPGHGLHPELVPAGLDAWVDWLEACLADLPPVDLVGYSLGGRLALLLALKSPERVRRLVLLGAGPGLESQGEREARHARDEGLAHRLERLGLEAFLREWYAQPLFSSLQEKDGFAELLARRAQGKAGFLAQVLRSASPGGQENLWPRLGELRMPVLWMAGTRDAEYAGRGVRAAARCPLGRPALVDGAGHAIHLEAPADVATLVGAFLA